MNRLIAALAAALLAPAAALAQAPAAPQQEQAQDASAQPAQPDTAAVDAKLAALEEKVNEASSAVKKLEKLKFSGYVQGRWAWLENDDYEAGPPSNNGFFVRRGRFKVTYDGDFAQYVVQLDATPSGVGVKEAFASFKLPWDGLAVDAGLQLMPFGYEVGVRSSADLDLLERSRASRSFLAGEYDVGVSVKGASGPFNVRVGV
ncbi:MAG TPA: porin, partial [Anaeromyxobacteraceae bacterium]|nr:porin [Anaeromyxobacteraceae bacterium]